MFWKKKKQQQKQWNLQNKWQEIETIKNAQKENKWATWKNEERRGPNPEKVEAAEGLRSKGGEPKGGARRNGGPKGRGPRGVGPRPRKSYGPKDWGRKGGGPKGRALQRGGSKGGGPKTGGPKFRGFFPSPAPIFVLFLSLWGSSRGILVVFEAPGPLNVHVSSSRAVVWNPGGPGTKN